MNKEYSTVLFKGIVHQKIDLHAFLALLNQDVVASLDLHWGCKACG